jgi:Zn-dependent protease
LSEADLALLEATIGVDRYRVLTRRPVTVLVGPRGYLPGLCGGLVAFAITYSRDGALSATATGIIGGLALLFSLAVHEGGHLLFSRAARGVEPRLLVMRSSGGVSIVQGRCEDARGAALFAAGGPIASLILTAAFIEVALVAPWEPLRIGLLLAAMLNVLLLIVNLLPVAPMDGFALFRAGVWAEVGSRAEAERRAITWSRVVLFSGLSLSLMVLTTDRLGGAAALCVIGTLTAQHRAAARRAAEATADQQLQPQQRR